MLSREYGVLQRMIARSGARRSRVRVLRVFIVTLLASLALIPIAGHAQTQPSGGTTANTESLLSGRPFVASALGITGWDISWPQCPTNEVPSGQVAFAVIGISGGRPFTENECFLQQFSWAVQNSQSTPQIYVNIAGLKDGWTDPTCAATDLPCNAYYYGKAAAVYAEATAKRYDADSPIWWLDVETANSWSTDQFLNDRVVGGAIEYLKATGHRVGIYSTPRVWNLLMGSYAPGVPVWTAGADDLQTAPARCSSAYAFGGGQVLMVQYVSEHLDANFSCVMPSWPGTRASVIPGLSIDGSSH